VLVLDYDLGEKEIIHGTCGKRKREITGYDILMFAIVNNCLPLTVQIITNNPVGRQKLHNGLIHDAKYVQKRICSHGRKLQIKTDSCLVLVNYNTELDTIVEEHVMFDEANNERITINRKIVITDFEKEVINVYSQFILSNITLLRHKS